MQAELSIPTGLDGAYYAPKILTHITTDMKVWKEEVFGPILPIVLSLIHIYSSLLYRISILDFESVELMLRYHWTYIDRLIERISELFREQSLREFFYELII